MEQHRVAQRRGINICEMDDDRFEEVYRTMQDAHIRAACFASAIANWARSINTPFFFFLKGREEPAAVHTENEKAGNEFHSDHELPE